MLMWLWHVEAANPRTCCFVVLQYHLPHQRTRTKPPLNQQVSSFKVLQFDKSLNEAHFLSWISYQIWFFVSGDIFGPSGETSNEKENEPRDADDTVLNKKGEFDGGGFLKDVKTVTPIFIYSNTVTMLSPGVGT